MGVGAGTDAIIGVGLASGAGGAADTVMVGGVGATGEVCVGVAVGSDVGAIVGSRAGDDVGVGVIGRPRVMVGESTAVAAASGRGGITEAAGGVDVAGVGSAQAKSNNGATRQRIQIPLGMTLMIILPSSK